MLVAELEHINRRYYETRRKATRHPRAGSGRSWGIRRDRLEARANRERRESLRKLGIFAT